MSESDERVLVYINLHLQFTSESWIEPTVLQLYDTCVVFTTF